MSTDRDSLVAAVRAADAEARHHKKLSNRHRQAAREARERQARLEEQCAALGITVTFETGKGNDPWPKLHSSISPR